jgi:hypothetical protein
VLHLETTGAPALFDFVDVVDNPDRPGGDESHRDDGRGRDGHGGDR